MQLLTTFYEDNKLLAMAAAAAAVLIVLVLLFLLYRVLFGRRLRTASNGRVRQPRLGIVDAYDLDRQRQLVLVRRDNVEHLIMIGGPTDVVIESSIIRAQQQPMRDKEAGPAIGPMPTPTVLPSAAQPPSLAVAPQAPSLAAPVPNRVDPPLAAPRPVADRPVLDRPAPNRVPPRTAPAFDARLEPSPPRGSSSNGVTARPPSPPSQPSVSATAASPAQTEGAPADSQVGPVMSPVSDPTPISGASAPRPPLPPRVPTRQPLPPRPPTGSSLPPRPTTRPLPSRAEPPLRTDPTVRPGSDGPAPVPFAGPSTPPPIGSAPPRGGPGPGGQPEPRIAMAPPVQSGPDTGTRRVEPPPISADPPASSPSARAETLESLEEEMAKLLGRPIPRRDG